MSEKQSDKLKREIAEAEKSLCSIDNEINSKQAEIDALKEQVNELQSHRNKLFDRGYRFESGLIPRLKAKLKQALLEESDETKPRVVWAHRATYCNQGEYIVRKVTPKRITIAQIGHKCTSNFNRDGSVVSSHDKSKIDLAATFGDDA